MLISPATSTTPVRNRKSPVTSNAEDVRRSWMIQEGTRLLGYDKAEEYGDALGFKVCVNAMCSIFICSLNKVYKTTGGRKSILEMIRKPEVIDGDNDDDDDVCSDSYRRKLGLGSLCLLVVEDSCCLNNCNICIGGTTSVEEA